MANKHVDIETLLITAKPPHQQYLTPLDIHVTTARLVGLTALDLVFSPPKSIDMRALTINVVNSKYIHLEGMNLVIDSVKNVALTALTSQYIPAKFLAMSPFTVYHKTLRKHEFTSLTLQELMIPTLTRHYITNISALALKRKAFSCLDISSAFPHSIINVKIPMTTYWASQINTNISGSIVAHSKITNTHLYVLYDSAEPYFGPGNVTNKFYSNIKTAIGKAHALRTTIFADTDLWYTQCNWVSTNIKAAAERTKVFSTSLFVLGSRTPKIPVNIFGRKGLYQDNFKVSAYSLGLVDYSGNKLWLTQQTLLGYSEFNRQVKYGFYVKLLSNIAGYNIENAWLGFPLESNNSLTLGVTVALVNNTELIFTDYATPMELESLYGTITAVSGTIQPYQQYGYINITPLVEEFQDRWGSGNIILKVTPSDAMLHSDALLHKPFLYRMYSINMNGNFIYKIFNKPGGTL
jgi:hypothetical protein